MRYIFCICLVSAMTSIFAQNVYIPMNVQKAMKKGTRTASGEPGPAYWENKADYDLDIQFDPKTRMLTGKEIVVYYNNSPDDLDLLPVYLYPDYYKKGMDRLWPVDAADESDGVQIDDMQIGNQKVKINNSPDDKGAGQYSREGTILFIQLDAPIKSGATEHVTINWHYIVNKGSHNRTGGVDETSFFIAYCFPRISVYDDIDGWDTHSFNGLQEFYNDFGNFTASVVVPKNYVVWGTGNLVNPSEVLSPEINDRLNGVMHSDSIRFIITQDDIDAKKVTADNKWNTWKFTADNVTDFAFALSDHYVWQSSSLEVDKTTHRRVRVDAAYNPAHKSYEHVADVARRSVLMMSYQYPNVPFPYPHETIFDGLDQMEYPMMVNDNPLENFAQDVNLTSHEIFHTYFPFYMGVNETKYAWMDEGWATIGEYVLSKEILNDKSEVFLKNLYEPMAGTDEDLPMITVSTQLSGNAYWENSYGKPALVYLYLRDILGDDVFFKCLHNYIDTWHGKHPTPYDFFNCFNKASGKNLSWFWNAWFYQPGYADVAMLNVIKNSDSKYTVAITDKGNKPVPVDAVVTFADNTQKTFHYSPAIWETNNIYYIPVETNQAVIKVELQTANIPDADKTNNNWSGPSR